MLKFDSYMNSVIRLPLPLDAEQTARLLALQAAFAGVCNVLAPVVAEQRCWNRVTLHHLMYRPLREQFPALGSQMICNAIYMVCKMSRLVYQGSGSPFHVALAGAAVLPTIRFDDQCPVHFDSHTLSMKSGQLSIFTMGGRMRFALPLKPAHMLRFASKRVLEITLLRRPDGVHELSFFFESPAAASAVVRPPVLLAPNPAPVTPVTRARPRPAVAVAPRWPDYLHVEATP